MTAQTRATLYTYFNQGDKPTEAQFANLIDSNLNLVTASAQSISSDVSALGKLDVIGSIVTSGALTSYGDLTVSSSAQSNLTGNVFVGGTLTVSANTTENAATFNGAITVAGSANFTSGITLPSSANASLTGNLSVTGLVTPSQTVGIKGTTTNNNANAGSIGEVLTATATDASVSLLNATAKTIISVSLTAGDWNVWGVALFSAGASTTVTQQLLGINSVDNTFSSLTANYVACNAAFTGIGQVLATPVVRVSLASTTTYYLVGQASFGVSTMTAGGTITARRVR